MNRSAGETSGRPPGALVVGLLQLPQALDLGGGQVDGELGLPLLLLEHLLGGLGLGQGRLHHGRVELDEDGPLLDPLALGDRLARRRR